MFYVEVIHPYGRIILVPIKKFVFQFPVPAVYEFFQGTFLDYFYKAIFHSEFLGFKKVLAECPAKNASFFLRAPLKINQLYIKRI